MNSKIKIAIYQYIYSLSDYVVLGLVYVMLCSLLYFKRIFYSFRCILEYLRRLYKIGPTSKSICLHLKT